LYTPAGGGAKALRRRGFGAVRLEIRGCKKYFLCGIRERALPSAGRDRARRFVMPSESGPSATPPRLWPGGITESGGDFTVDAERVAPELGLTPEAFWQALQNGAISSVVERGEGEHLGSTRLTLRYFARSWCATLRE
jgi:hypothetical protein